MRKSLMLVIALFIMAMPALAQGSGPEFTGNAVSPWWIAVSAAFGMAIASGLAALGQGKATAAAAEALARNPGARAGIQFALILGLALIESLALYTLVIIFLKVK